MPEKLHKIQIKDIIGLLKQRKLNYNCPMSNFVPSVEELKVLRTRIIDVNREHKESFTKLEKVALYTTDKIGTMGFFFLVSIWTILWLLWNTVGPESLRFDAYPSFVLWLLISNIIQLAFLPLIMVGQNLQNRHAEVRAQNDFEINVKSEREIEAILMHLEQQNQLVLKILSRLDLEDKK